MAQLQIRDVPAELHRKLRARAANTGQSLAEYVLDELARAVEHHEQIELAGSDASESAEDEEVAAVPTG